MWSRARHTIRRIKHTWAELDYAQRRLFEIQTGIPTTPKGSGRRPEWRAMSSTCCSRASIPRSTRASISSEQSTPAPAPLAHV